MARASGWPALFWDAFKQSRNGMVLLDEQRCQVEVNPAYVELLGAHRSALLGRPVYEHIEDGPIVSAGEWRVTIQKEGFSGVVRLVRGDGELVTVQFAGHPETVTGKRLVLLVVISTARGGGPPPAGRGPGRAAPRGEAPGAS